MKLKIKGKLHDHSNQSGVSAGISYHFNCERPMFNGLPHRALCLVWLTLVLAAMLHAQGVGINTTGVAADTSAMLDVSSTSKGFLPPRMTAAQRTAIILPATGLVVYQTDATPGFFYNSDIPASPNWKRLIDSTTAGVSSQWTTSGSNIYYTGGNVGIGASPTIADGVLDVAGRMRIRGGGNLATSAGSWLNNVNNTALSAFVGMENDTSVGFYGAGGAGWTFGMNTRTGDVKMFGRLGIGTTTPNAPLSFPPWLGKKITLYPGVSGDVGFGVFNNELRINSDYSGADITFGYDDNTLGFTERMRIKGNGNVGIGTTTPNAPLGFPPTTGKKITLFPGVNGDYGIGVFNYELRINSDYSGADITFGYDDNTLGFTERMRIKGNGNVGIGTSSPAATLAVSSSGNFNNPQISLNQGVGADWARVRFMSANTATTTRFWDVAGFLGMGGPETDRLNFWNSSGGGTFGLGGNGALYVNNNGGQPAQVLTSEGSNAPAHWETMGNIIQTYYNNTAPPSIVITTDNTSAVYTGHTYPITVTKNSRLLISVNFSLWSQDCFACADRTWNRFIIRINGVNVTNFPQETTGWGLTTNVGIANYMYDIGPGTYTVDFAVEHGSGNRIWTSITNSSLMVLPR